MLILHYRLLCIALTFSTFSETGYGYSRNKAKGEAARRVLDKLRVAGERNESLHDVTQEVVKKCYEMYCLYI